MVGHAGIIFSWCLSRSAFRVDEQWAFPSIAIVDPLEPFNEQSAAFAHLLIGFTGVLDTSVIQGVPL